MPTRARLLISTVLAIVMLSLIGSLGLAGAFFALALLGTVITAQKTDLWLAERREYARLLEQAERQHGAYMAGDDHWGVYGVSPTAPTERAA